ncbi:MAG TPA: right-handed parallel beta-helix repeat-containing protein [Pyrinomonadaceae bacterium]|nr:right-handed parallel beta-helix repeat-containing protein [Pyrinomonadaceae bacterium]
MSQPKRKIRLGRFDQTSLVCYLLSLIIALSGVSTASAQNSKDLPNPTANLTSIPDGSLVIAMDNTNQALVAPFNLKAYGLVNNLLQNGIPLMWAIRAGKAKDGVDFTATAQRISPTTTAAATYNFAGGPFIVHRDHAQLARTRITAFGNQVAVYELTQNAGQSVTVDIRYQLTHKPVIAVSNTNSDIHTDILDAAAIPNYSIVNPTNLSAGSCYTSHSEPHTSLTPGIPNVKAFVQSGGNFLAQCAALGTYENDVNGNFQTTAGIVISNMNNVLSYPVPDLSYSQFVGALEPNPGGSETDYRLAVGSVFTNNGHVQADNIGASPATYAATGAKLYNGSLPGGMVFYLGGHDYTKSNTLGFINGQRMLLNMVFTPSTRPLGCNLDFLSSLRAISGHVYEDLNGDSSLTDAVPRTNVNARLYADTNSTGILDAGDTFLSETTTDSGGVYAFQVSTQASGNRYFVVVNSREVSPAAGLNGGFSQGDVWAEQTYGDDPTSTGLTLGARYSGINSAISDNFNLSSNSLASNTYKHQALVEVASASINNLDFAFSFNVMTNTRAGDAADDDTSASRTVQGSLRQFIQNANAIAASNVMRFVPAVSLNAGSWWRASVTTSLPAITDQNTSVDGTAYSNTDGITLRDTNAGLAGTGGVTGVDGLALSQVGRPELEIVDGSTIAVGLDLQAANTTIRRIAIYGFGNSANNNGHTNLRIGSYSGVLIEQNFIGTGAANFTDPGASRSGGDNLRAIGSLSGTLRYNLIGFSAGLGVGLISGSNGWQVYGNEIRSNGIGNSNLGGVDIYSSAGGIVSGNLFVGNEGAGLDSNLSAGANQIVNNTISGNGVGAGANVVTSGVRLYGTGNTVDRNVLNANFGAGLMITSGSTMNLLTRNSIFANGTITNNGGAGPGNQIGIDLLSASDNQNTGTTGYVTINDAADSDAGGNGLLNFPVLTSAQVLNGNLILNGYSLPGSNLEFFIAAADPSGFGEGQTFVTTLVEGSAGDTDATTGTYSSPVNGLNVGTDTTNKFQFSLPLPAGVNVGTVLTATATLSGSTSEFSGNITVVAAPPNVVLVKSVAPNGTQPPGTDLTYAIEFSNTGGLEATTLVVTDPVPSNTDFKLGSVTTNLGTTGLTVTVGYSNDGGGTWTYTPVSSGGGAPAGYDRLTTNVRWVFTGNLSPTAPNNLGSVGFTVRIR